MSGKLGALVVAAAMVAIMQLVLHFDMAKGSKNYVSTNMCQATAGPSNRLLINYYPSGRTLHTGDTLQFIYDMNTHNVVGVGRMGYRWCDGGKGKEYNSGNDTIKLINGMNYFICTKLITTPGNQNMCDGYQMKIAVHAK
ncbi:hypothetical protein CASFOL_041826 [Castilleja foliolosa]|uniref:Phytocyanin domain-containing protein n=1 Tax=Castilleja foliolosa TaxID=1961234 RepID=A0ABD3B8U2_9LAMI